MKWLEMPGAPRPAALQAQQMTESGLDALRDLREWRQKLLEQVVLGHYQTAELLEKAAEMNARGLDIVPLLRVLSRGIRGEADVLSEHIRSWDLDKPDEAAEDYIRFATKTAIDRLCK